MKILVPVKRVIDPYVKIRIKSDGTGVETQQVKMVMNPFDEIALEEALRLQEQGIATEVICLSIGEQSSLETLRHGLAMGAQSAILIDTAERLQSFDIAKIIAKIVEDEHFDLVLMGKQSIDNDANQTPQMLAGRLNWPQACFASKIKIDKNKALVTRETDAGLEQLSLTLPAVISVDLRLNEPRYATLPNIMKAKAKPVRQLELASLGLEFRADVEQIAVLKPVARQKGEILPDLDALLEKIRPILLG